MKNSIILFKLLFILSISANAQTVLGDFENYDGVGCTHPYYGGIDAFRKGCLGNTWKVSHGSPDVFTEGGSYPDYDFDNVSAAVFAGIYNGSTASEGLFYDGITFYPYNTYTISLKVAVAPSGQGNTTTVQHIYFKLANGLTAKTTSTPENVSIPSVAQSQVVQDLQNVSNTSWQTVTFTFQPNQVYNQFWFYLQSPNVTLNNGIYAVIDDIYLTNISQVGDDGCCTPYLTYSNTSSLPVFSKAFYTVTAGTNTNVLSGQDVTFQAGDAVILTPGFHAQSGSNFLAFLAPCTSNSTPIPADAGADQYGCLDNVDCVTIGTSSTSPYTTYSWSASYAGDMNYLSPSNSATPNVCSPPSTYNNGRHVTEGGKLLIFTLTATTCGNASTDEVNVVFLPPPYCGARMSASSEEEKLQEIVVYPNPAREKAAVRLNLKDESKAEMYVYNAQGKQIYHQHLGNVYQAEVPLDLSGETSGIFYIKVITRDKILNQEFILVK